MRIKSLTLERFRGIGELTIRMDGRDCAIMGANGTGKTTVANAITWLLCDAPFTGETGFTPKTAGVHDVRHKAEMEAIADDGETVTLCKEFYEKWTRRRGEGKPVFSGHATDCRVDGVPVSAAEYARRVAELTGRSCEQAKMSLIHGHFAEQMRPEARRAVLFDLIAGVGGLSDAEIVGGHPGLADLPRILGRKNVEDWRKVAAETRKRLNKDLDSIPVRIDELTGQLKATRMPADIEREIKLAEQSMAQGDPNAAIRAELAEARAKHQKEADDFNARLGAMVNAASTERCKARIALDDDNHRLAHLKQQIADAKAKRAELIDEWKRVCALEYQGDGKCPTCHQPLPAAMIEEARARFDDGKAARQADINERGAAVSQNVIEGLETRAGALAAAVEQDEATLAELDAKLTDLRARCAEPVPFEETDECKALMARLTPVGDGDGEAKRRLAALRDELAEAKAERDVSLRIDELRAEQSAKAAELDKVDRGLAMCDLFTSRKASLITEAVNGLFETVRWQLFRPLINGGVEQVCNPMTRSPDGKWVEWRASNTAAQVNAGLEIAHVLNARFGVELPVIIDRAESVSEPLKVPEQTIRLVVSPGDAALRVAAE